MARRTPERQAELPFPNSWGGRREGAGRKRKQRGLGWVPHDARGALDKNHPVLVTIRVRNRLPSLRIKRTFEVVRQAFVAGCERHGFRLVQFSVQADHVHMICEADDRRSLSRGLQGLQIRLAKALNRLWGRKGPVFVGRYHERVLATPRQVRNALVYVLQNIRKHNPAAKLDHGLDPFASGYWFQGWKVPPATSPPTTDPPVTRSRCWLINVGWHRHHGRIHVLERPKQPA